MMVRRGGGRTGAGRPTVGAAAIAVTVGTVFANAFGVAKSVLVARYFGIDVPLDAYTAAAILPTILSGIVFGAMQMSVIPVFAELRARGGEAEAERFFRSFLGLALLVFSGCALAAALWPRAVIAVTAPGFRDERFFLAADLLRIIAPSVVVRGVADLLGGLFHANKRFGVPALATGSGVAVSLVYLVLWHAQGARALSYGLLAGSVAQLVIMVVASTASGYRVVPSLQLRGVGMDMAARILAPSLLGLCFSQANVLVDQVMASSLPRGSVAALNYAISIHDVVMQLFVAALGAAVFPFLSQSFAEGRPGEFLETVRLAVRIAIYVLAPVMVLVLVLGLPAVRIALQRGEFDAAATVSVGNAWKALSLGLCFSAVNNVLARALTARGRTRALAGVTFASLFANVVLNTLLMGGLRHVGIALSTSLTAVGSTAVLVALFERDAGRLADAALLLSVAKLAVCAAVMGGATWLVSAAFGATSLPGAVLAGLTGLAAYAALSRLWNLEEFRVIRQTKLSRSVI